MPGNQGTTIMDWVEFIKMAKSFSNLRGLILSMVCPAYSSDMESLSKKFPATSMEYLDHLSVELLRAFHVESSPLRILEYIDVPSLVSYTHAYLKHSHIAIAGLATFLSRTQSLVHLSLGGSARTSIRLSSSLSRSKNNCRLPIAFWEGSTTARSQSSR